MNEHKWTVEVKGHPTSSSKSWEISIVRNDNDHGFRSYGWFDERKILISHNGGPCRWPIPSCVFDASVDIANQVCEALNQGLGYDELMWS